MTTAPVMTITEELLDQIDSLLGLNANNALTTPLPYLSRVLLEKSAAHIRSLSERLEKAEKDAERYAWLREKHNDNDADYAVMKFSKRANEWLHLDWKLDAAVDAEMEAGK